MRNIIEDWLKPIVESWIKSYLDRHLGEYISQGYFDDRIKAVTLHQYLVFGDGARLHLSSSCVVNNALFNLASGDISVGDRVFFGHNVSVITGTHPYTKFGVERMEEWTKAGNDIVISEGVWVASNATIIGPSNIGKHSVVAAGSVVKGDVPSYTVVAGVPAKVIKKIEP